MLRNKALYLSMFLLLGLDLGYTFMQQYARPLDGDMAAIIVPSEHYEAVLESPFGWKALQQDTTYAAPNRFFIHWAMYHYFRQAPLWLQRVASPADSIYLSAAILKTAIHFLLIWLLALYIGGKAQLFSRNWLVPALLATPLFQSGGYYANLMGIVDRSPTYAFFYAFPMVLLLLYYYPAYRVLVQKQPVRPGWAGWAGIAGLAVVLPFTGPLAPGVILVLSLMMALQWAAAFLKKTGNGQLPFFQAGLPAGYGISLLALNLLSLYSLYIGTFNIEHQDSLGILERYAKLPPGLFHQFTRKPGPAVLLFMILINALLLRFKVKNEQSRQALSILQWIGLFSLVYLLLLPLGGYRDYRALIIRRDTILPVMLALIYFWGLSAYLLLNALPPAGRRWYAGFALSALALFTLADEPGFGANACERAALAQLHQSSADVVRLSDDCLLLAWDPIRGPGQSSLQCELLTLWNITGEGQRFYQE